MLHKWFRKEGELSQKALQSLADTIERIEKTTSGEIRLFIQKRAVPSSYHKNPYEIAREIFEKHQMYHTKNRNGILLYVSLKDKKVAIYGDEGIHHQVGQDYWTQTIHHLIGLLKQKKYEEGLHKTIIDIGEKLKHFFPYEEADTNELSNEIMVE